MTPAEYPKFYLYKRIVQAKLFIDEHFADPINLDNISGEACFSKFHFIRLFKKSYGKTPHQYLITVRIENAKAALTKGLSIAEACMAVGFESLPSFSGLFKKSTGYTASGYVLEISRQEEKMKNDPLSFVPGCYAHKNGWIKNSNFGEAG
jgi:AraC-like DNA-binding protein